MSSLDLRPSWRSRVDPAVEPVGRRRPLLGTAAVVAGLAGVNVAGHLAPSARVPLGVGASAALLAAARADGLTWEDLGLGREQVRRGLLAGGGAAGVVAVAYGGGLLVPLTRPLFLDERYRLDVRDAVRAALVVIPLSTVLLEEVAFRSVLWGMLERHGGTTRALLVSSTSFGLWHVLPSLDLAGARGVRARSGPGGTALVVLGTVGFTTVGGLVAGELRRRSGHVIASAGMHWATNALGVLAGLVAWRAARGS
ncbi:MAG TPA: CPBP family intramembrane glutamic endopeptidase [Nocardioidaceae bacterium]